MVFTATVLSVGRDSMLVRDIHNGQEIRVNSRDARRFSRGDCVRIVSTGTMTFSIPPQITAVSIQRTSGCGQTVPESRPVEMRAVVLQRRRDSLLVRDLETNRQVLVRAPFAHHFCPGQRVIIRHDSMIMGNPPEVRATDITPIC